MLFWQRKNTHNSIPFWFKLAWMSAAIHITLLVLFFFIIKDRTSRLSLVITPDILFTIESKSSPKTKSKQSSKAATSAAVQSKSESKPEPKVEKKVEKKEKPQTTIAKKVEKKTTPKKVDKKPVAKKGVDKKAVKDKKVESDKKAEPLKTPVKEPVPTPLEKKVEPPVEQPGPSAADTLAQVDHHELEVNKLGLYEKGLIEEFKLLHEEIVAQWAPPPGITPGCSCKITMLIDWEGVIRDFTVNESSGVLVYDTAAQKALTQVKMPRWAWGKEITITFNQ